MQIPPADTDTLRVALFQGPAVGGDVAANMSAISAAAQRASANGARIVVTPEMSATGYHIGALSAQRAEPPDGPLHQSVASVAVKYGIAIIYGYPECSADGNYNAVAAVGPGGEALGSHHKAHLFGDLDRGMFVAGQNLVSQFEFDGWTCGLAVCYDIEFPELARAHADAGTQVLFVPTALMTPFEVVSRIIVPARAYENQFYVVYVNRCDVEQELTYCGLSCAVGPDGTDLARAGTGEQLLVVDMDPAAIPAGRAINTYLPDRRSDLYPVARQQPAGNTP